MKAGVALNPGTPVSLLEDVAADLDMILIMSVILVLVGNLLFQMLLKKLSKLKCY